MPTQLTVGTHCSSTAVKIIRVRKILTPATRVRLLLISVMQRKATSSIFHSSLDTDRAALLVALAMATHT
jgi:hypothetical protein